MAEQGFTLTRLFPITLPRSRCWSYKIGVMDYTEIDGWVMDYTENLLLMHICQRLLTNTDKSWTTSIKGNTIEDTGEYQYIIHIYDK